MGFICNNITVNENGQLCFAGRNTVELAKKYATPLYLMDEDRIRENCRTYHKAFAKYFNDKSYPIYASKACCFKRMLQIVSEEGFGFDVVSPGEIYTAVKAGVDMSKAYYHSNDKTSEDIRLAMNSKVGYFVVESDDEAVAVDEIAAELGICQDILLRVTPGIDPHTYEAINTGKVDSKFGVPIETNQAVESVENIIKLNNIKLKGFHCHVGSCVFEEDVYERTVRVMTQFMAEAKSRFGFVTEIFNIGGGIGVRYTDSDPFLSIDEKLEGISKELKICCEKQGMDIPALVVEPGRSIVADAGMTLYTAGSVKTVKGYKKYISVDGGMTDNPRYALYKSKYTCYAASKMNEECDDKFDIVGRCCESGDIVQPAVAMPSSVTMGDIIAVCTTGAYNYSMASNYNRVPRPPIVMLSQGDDYVAVKRESLEDIVKLDV